MTYRSIPYWSIRYAVKRTHGEDAQRKFKISQQRIITASYHRDVFIMFSSGPFINHKLNEHLLHCYSRSVIIYFLHLFHPMISLLFKRFDSIWLISILFQPYTAMTDANNWNHTVLWLFNCLLYYFRNAFTVFEWKNNGNSIIINVLYMTSIVYYALITKKYLKKYFLRHLHWGSCSKSWRSNRKEKIWVKVGKVWGGFARCD